MIDRIAFGGKLLFNVKKLSSKFKSVDRFLLGFYEQILPRAIGFREERISKHWKDVFCGIRKK